MMSSRIASGCSARALAIPSRPPAGTGHPPATDRAQAECGNLADVALVIDEQDVAPAHDVVPAARGDVSG